MPIWYLVCSVCYAMASFTNNYLVILWVWRPLHHLSHDLVKLFPVCPPSSNCSPQYTIPTHYYLNPVQPSYLTTSISLNVVSLSNLYSPPTSWPHRHYHHPRSQIRRHNLCFPIRLRHKKRFWKICQGDSHCCLPDWFWNLTHCCSRFILNLPDEEFDSLERLCFQVEQAYVGITHLAKQHLICPTQALVLWRLYPRTEYEAPVVASQEVLRNAFPRLSTSSPLERWPRASVQSIHAV